MLLTGSFQRSIDEKLRIAIPKRLRAVLECPKGASLFVAPGTDDSLVLYTEEAFSQLAKRLAGVSPTQKDVRAYMRLFFARAAQVEIDGQGRIRIPQELANLAQLSKEIVLLGVQDHMELWAAERWEAYLSTKQPHYDEIAEAALSGPRLEID